MREKIERTMDRARKGFNDTEIMLLRKVLAYTKTNMAGTVDLEEISVRIRYLRESEDIEDRMLAKETIQWLVIDTCKEMATEMEAAIFLTAVGHEKLYSEANRRGLRAR
jgi:hypothetical protein